MTSRRTRTPILAAALGAVAVGGLALFNAGPSEAARNDYQLAQKPLYMGQSVPPLMMMVMSRDERLFTKAYSDYTDLNGDGVIDTTYNDKFDYAGYFDPNICYDYESSRFVAERAAGGDNDHGCQQGNVWSGNFLNWLTMSRLDVVRHVLYGGLRHEDTGSKTVLERAHIPNDLHAWVKVYEGSDIKDFVPSNLVKGNRGPVAFCNASFSASGTPKLRVADGNWSEWSATAISQCLVGRSSYQEDSPPSASEFDVRVEVCGKAAPLREAFCTPYGSGKDLTYKPTGLLQAYGESGRLRFGLISGSYSKPRSGGVLRRNIGKLAGNGDAGCAAGDEVNLSTGRFCNQGSGDEGIINTLNRFKLTKWSGSAWSDCPTWGINNRVGGQGQLDNPGGGANACSAWGNPIAEMYAEALRYIAGESGESSAFFGVGDLDGLPIGVKWKDPYRAPKDGGNSYCADCNILVLSSGLSSFDSDELPEVPQGIGRGVSATATVGSHEGVVGKYLVGRVGETPLNAELNTHEDICSAKDVTSLSQVRGICPDIPSLEGSYMLAGLAHGARSTDLRPNLQGKPSGYKNTVTTYAVALADNLPKFDVPVGDGKITLSPLCQANGSGSAKIRDSGWRTCHLGSVGVGKRIASVAPYHEYGRPLQLDAAKNAVAGSFSLVWEDSLWGNDHDNDVVAMLTYCVGSTCSANTNPKNTGYTGHDICWRSDSDVCTRSNRSPVVAEDEVLVRIENLSAYAGNAMLSGFAVTGSDNDGVHKLALRPGNTDGSLLTSTAEEYTGAIANWDKPKVMKFRRATSEAKLLETPLWYAAKYGGFEDDNDNGKPDAGEWDSRVIGTPDNYFFARDPSKLKAALEEIFEAAAASDESTGGGGAGARVGSDSFTVQAGYDVPDDSNDWTGWIRGFGVKEDGGRGEQLWDAASGIPAHGSRRIYMVTSPTRLDEDGTVEDDAEASEFKYSNLPGTTSVGKGLAMGLRVEDLAWVGLDEVDDVVDYLRGKPVPGFRSRSLVLGDIVNSDVAISTPRDDYGYGNWRYTSSDATPWKATLGTSYAAYLESKATRSPMVYVGANDGMLHAFTSGKDGGAEQFAFIPHGSLGHIGELANPNYDHSYFVDGGIALGDAPFSSSGDWRTVLVGSTGAGGGKRLAGGTTVSDGSVFALDVSTPGSFDGNDVLWELNGNDHDDLGFVLGRPHIVAIKGSSGPRWVALFGNGPNSSSGAPALFVVDLKTGQLLRALKPEGDAHAQKNGLMHIAPVALGNHHGLVDTVYGGDLQGNIWKFDLDDTSPASWEIAFAGEPLFTAQRGDARQPVAGAIEVSRGPVGGVTLFFGTGRYFAHGDNENTAVQTLYSIWDSPGGGRISAGRGALMAQAITAGTTANGHATRNVSRNTVSYATHRGWYVDLVVGDSEDGERFIGEPRLQSGRVIFTTYVPGQAMCSAGGGTNWQYALDLLSGGGAMTGVSLDAAGDSPVCSGAECGAISLDKGGNTSAPVKTVDVFVPKPLRPGVGGGGGVCAPGDPTCSVDELLKASKCTFVLHTPGADPLYLPRPCGRQSWRQVR